MIYDLFAIETAVRWDKVIGDFLVIAERQVHVRSMEWTVEGRTSADILADWDLDWLQEHVDVECDGSDAVFIDADGRYGPALFVIRRRRIRRP